MLSSVTVTVPARVHLGFFDLSATIGRRFGSIGLALERPVTSVTVRRAPASTVQGPEEERAGRHLETLKRALSLKGEYAVTINEAIPAHAGLGSGTQLALALAGAIRTLNGLPLAPRADAALLGRGARSGIGIGLFETGGLVVDGGRGGLDEPPPILARLAVPADWRILLVFDEQCLGVHGAAEVQAFRDLPSFPADSAARICHLVLMQALPALAEADLPRFGSAIEEVQQRLGEHFAPAQGGVFTSPAVQAAVRFLAAHGGHGPGQSSWGPTGFVFARSAADAAELAAAFGREKAFDGLRLDVVAARNHGAVIERGDAVTSLHRPSTQQQRQHR
ncbi:MAG: beta-ribofuranosylaminobenzene 5'-phosphate synthase family protein [Hyphomicrobiales bacterium]